MELIKGFENSLYRVYKDENNIYYHYKGNVCDLKFKSKRWYKTIEMQIGYYPTKNFKIIK